MLYKTLTFKYCSKLLNELDLYMEVRSCYTAVVLNCIEKIKSTKNVVLQLRYKFTIYRI